MGENSNNINKYLIPLIGILIGYGSWRVLTLLLILLLSIFILINRFKFYISRSELFFSIIVILMPLSIGLDNVINNENLDGFKGGLYIISIFIISYSINNKNDSDVFIFSIFFGMLVYASLSMYYTIKFLPPPYYGRVYDIHTSEIVNSPDIANKAIVFLSYAMISISNIFRSKRITTITILSVLLIISAYISVLTASRTFIIVATITITYIYLKYLILNAKYKITNIILTILTIYIILLNANIDNLSQYFIVNRFLDHGIESGRLDLMTQGFSQLLNNSMSLRNPNEIISTYWYHNILLDTLYSHGLFVFILLTIIFITIFLKSINIIINNKYSNKSNLILILIIAFIMSTSVVSIFHPQFHLFIALYISTINKNYK